MFRIKRTDGGDPRKQQKSLSATISTHSHNSHTGISQASPRTMKENANLKGFTSYILCRVSRKPQGKLSEVAFQLNQRMNSSSVKALDAIVRKVDSMAVRNSVLNRKLDVVFIRRDRRTASRDRL